MMSDHAMETQDRSNPKADHEKEVEVNADVPSVAWPA